jgi:hypothetical protein
MEGIHAQLASLGRPAVAYIPAPELTAFFGKADYQANLLSGMTNLLSCGDEVDVTTKGEFAMGRRSIILEPTITMHAGSTVDWLHKNMPEGTMEGGFLGRFLIIPEEFSGRMIPLVKRELTRERMEEVRGWLDCWHSGLSSIISVCKQPREMILLDDAEQLYINWYMNRFKLFSKAVMPYANRSRDMVLRLAMLMALSRGHDRFVEGVDVAFAIHVLSEVAKRIDAIVLPPSKESALWTHILPLLPATAGKIYYTLGTRWGVKKEIEPALQALCLSGQVRYLKGVYEIIPRGGDEE